MKTLLKRRRLQLHLKQKDIAFQLGYGSSQFVSNWERGISTPPLKSLRQLCDILEIHPEVFKKVLFKNFKNEVDVWL